MVVEAFKTNAFRGPNQALYFSVIVGKQQDIVNISNVGHMYVGFNLNP